MEKKKKLTLRRTAIAKLADNSLQRVGGGPGHGTTNRCVPYTWPSWGETACATICWPCSGVTCYACTAFEVCY